MPKPEYGNPPKRDHRIGAIRYGAVWNDSVTLHVNSQACYFKKKQSVPSEQMPEGTHLKSNYRIRNQNNEESEKQIMNNCVFMGRLARDPEYRVVQGREKELRVAEFLLVVKRNRSARTFVIKVSAYHNDADFVRDHLSQGTKVMVSGELNITSHTDDQTGTTRYYTSLEMSNLEFGESKRAAQEREAEEGFVRIPEGTDPFDVPDGMDSDLPFR